jgi:hypothetical protein
MSSTPTITHTDITAGTIPCNPNVITAQIGRTTILGISGGRRAIIAHRETGETVGLDLPVSSGYHVLVTLAADDTYTVRRVMKRGAKLFDKGVVHGVHCDQVEEVAWNAHAFRNGPFGA